MSLVRRVIKPLGQLFGQREPTDLRESLEDVIEQHDNPLADKSLRAQEWELLNNILNNADVRTEDIMVHRADIVSISAEADFDTLIDTFIDAGHSRLPLFQGDLDHVTGMVHVKDALKVLVEGPTTAARPPITSMQRPVLFVSPSMRALDLLAKMRATRAHMAVVVDEYGGTDGLVTIEDMVEQVVGEIHDEHDEDESPRLTALEDGRFDADARVEIEDLADAIARPLSAGPGREDDVDTLGGLVFTLAGRVPQIGEVVEDAIGTRYEVVDADPRRIKRLRVTPGPLPLDEAAAK